MIPAPSQPGDAINWRILINGFIVNEFIPKHIPKGLQLKDVEFDLIWYYIVAKCYLQSVESSDPKYHILKHQTLAQIKMLLTSVLTGSGYYMH